MFMQLSSAVKYLHDKKFAHLDIKLENLLLDEYFNIKLADFGSGVSVLKTKGLTSHKVGTPLYMPPEIKHLQNGNTFDGLKADIYSLGVTLCLLLLGELPDLKGIGDESTVGSSELTDCDEIDVDMTNQKQSQKWKFLSTNAKDLLVKMMHENPEKRPSIDEVLAHEWFTSEQIDGLQEYVFMEMKARSEFSEDNMNF